jgi:hypothetical protein
MDEIWKIASQEDIHMNTHFKRLKSSVMFYRILNQVKQVEVDEMVIWMKLLSKPKLVTTVEFEGEIWLIPDFDKI